MPKLPEEAIREKARSILQVPPDATLREVEAAYLKQLSRLKAAFTRLGGFETQTGQPHQTFESFVSGESNAVTVRALQEACSNPGGVYNPLFIHGKPGVGKTHLLRAAWHALRQRETEGPLVMTSADILTDDLITAIADHTPHLFHVKYRGVDALLVDNVQGWSTRARLQEEVMSIVDHLVAAGKQIIFTSACPPRDLTGVMEGLVSRFAGGLTVELEYPDFATRKRIVEALAARMQLTVARELVINLARRRGGDIRELEGALRKLQAHEGCNGQTVTEDSLDELLYDLPAPRTLGTLSLDELQDVVAMHFKLGPGEIANPRGGQKLKRVRHVGMFLARSLTPCSLQEIGDAFNASTNQVLYGVRTVKQNLDDPVCARDVETLRRRLEAVVTRERPEPGAAAPSPAPSRSRGARANPRR